MNTNNLKNKIITLLKSNNLTVEATKASGFMSFITHNRYRYIDESKSEMVLEPIYDIDEYNKKYGLVSAKGGETAIELVDKETGIEARAVAICALTDVFERKVGIRYAINRCLRQMLVKIKNINP